MTRATERSTSGQRQNRASSGRIPLYTHADVARPAQLADRPDLAPEKYRSSFRRDFARLIHSPAFRRLQGKVQLFPPAESDFFRNRLTHSLEVAQIAKSIAVRLNDINKYFREFNIDADLVEFAGLAHDLGHPPFGHNGEAELDRQMLEAGGFEGNAQTLRILSRLEKKQTLDYPHRSVVPVPVVNREDNRAGLNLTFRALASILKYDRQIPQTLDARKKSKCQDKPVKGYYAAEGDLVREIKRHVASGYEGRFKTIECSIMDIADDIAYSTYDLEDAFKGGFLSPISILALQDNFKEGVVRKVQAKLNEEYPDAPLEDRKFELTDYNATVRQLFSGILDIDLSALPSGRYDASDIAAVILPLSAGVAEKICTNGYYRSEFTSELVGTFVRSVDVEVNEKFPAMSKPRMSIEAFVSVEILKTLAFEAVIMSSALKAAEHRGQWIVERIFTELQEDGGYLLMPDDWRQLIEADDDNNSWKARTICDYIAGMTDSYCIEYYERILGRAGPSIQKRY